MSVKFFSFSKLRKFLKQDLTSLATKRYLNGFRQTFTCQDCKSVVYSILSNEDYVCECGRYKIRENKYHYKFEDLSNKNETDHRMLKSIHYYKLREIKC